MNVKLGWRSLEHPVVPALPQSRAACPKSRGHGVHSLSVRHLGKEAELVPLVEVDGLPRDGANELAPEIQERASILEQCLPCTDSNVIIQGSLWGKGSGTRWRCHRGRDQGERDGGHHIGPGRVPHWKNKRAVHGQYRIDPRYIKPTQQPVPGPSNRRRRRCRAA